MADLTHFFISGGPVVWLLISFSTVALTISFVKIWQFWLIRETSQSSIEEALSSFEKGKSSQVMIMINGQNNIRAQLLVQILKLLDSGILKIDEVKNEAFRKARFTIANLGNYLRILEVIASLAPLLGLLGTVLGMIEAFQAMEAAGSQVNPAILSGGIWKALLTTAIGVAVAIPVSIAHSWFERKVEVQASLIQNDLERLFTLVYMQNSHQAPAIEVTASAS